MPIPSEWSQKFEEFITEWKRKSDNHEYIGSEYLGDNPFHHFVVAEPAETWDDFLRWIDELGPNWCFRGQREASWTFETSLDRGVKRESYSPTLSAMWRLNRGAEMRPLLYRFQQYAHTYLQHVPAVDDISSWYALMQHHGAPTPLLDWTASPFVGMYFAIEYSATENRHAIWAVDSDWLAVKGRAVLEQKDVTVTAVDGSPVEIAEEANRLLKEMNAPLVLRINPAMSNSRLFAQQGLFLCKLIEQASVAQLLMTMVMYPDLTGKSVIRKLEIAKGCRFEFLKRLRTMNIHRASLFPGLDGLGLSLKLDLELRERD